MADAPHDHRRLPTYGNRRNIGAYEQPYSDVGMEFEPLGSPSVDTEIVLHEVGYWPSNYDWNYSSVYSPFWRIYYDFEVGHSVRFGDQSTALGPDTLLVIPNHQRFDCIGDPPVPKLWIHFSCGWNVEPRTKVPITIPVDTLVGAMIAEFPRLFRGRPSEQRMQVRRVGFTFLTYLLGDSRIPRQRSVPDRIASVMDRINQKPGYAWSNPELASSVSMSTESFIRWFKRWTGETPIRYVQQVRVRDACRLLASTDASIERIASKTGFPDRFYFSRVFKRHTGRSPAAYRKGASMAERADQRWGEPTGVLP